MAIKITTKKYIEQSNEINHFTCVYTHIPQSEEVHEVRGQMYSVINISGPQGLNAIDAVNLFLDKLENVYFSEEPAPVPTILERAIRSALFEVNAYFESVNIVDDIIFDFGAVVVKDDIVYIAKVEQASIYLIRDNKVLNLGTSLHDVSNLKLIEQGSGILEIGDRIILANASSEELIADWSLLSRYSESEINRLITNAQYDTQTMAFLIIEIERGEEFIPQEKTMIEEPVNLVEEAEKIQVPIEEESMTIEEDIPSIHETSPANSGQSFLGNLMDKADIAGENLVHFALVILKKIKGYGVYVYQNREKIAAAIIAWLQWGIGKIQTLLGKVRGKDVSMDKEEIRTRLSRAKSAGFSSNKKAIERIRKNKRVVLPLVAIGLLFFFILFSHIKSGADYTKRVSQYNQIVTNLKADLSLAHSAANATQIDSIYNKDIALIGQGENLHINTNELEGYKSQITAIEYQTHNMVAVNPQILSDLSLAYSDVKLKGIAEYNDTLLVVGTNNVYSLSTHAPSTGTKLPSNLISDPLAITELGTDGAVIYDRNNGILKIDASLNITQVPGLSDIKNVGAIASFEGNLYFLDPSDQIIYKSVSVGDGYSLASTYIKDQNLSDANAIGVDGNVFVSTPTQGIIRYYGSNPTPFKIGMLDTIGKPLGPITYMYDNKYLQNIYIIDPQNNRILVLAKPTGSDTVTYNFVRQYIYTGNQNLFNSLTALTIDTVEKNMYVLNGSRVLKISL